MNYIPHEPPKEQIDGETFEYLQLPHHIFQQRRKELKLTQQQVADQARIQLRQYQRLESGEQSVCGSSSRIFFSVCQVLRLEPEYMLGLNTMQNVPDFQRKKCVILDPVDDDGIYYYIPQSAYFQLVCEIPCGMIATYDAIKECLRKAYNLSNGEIKNDMDSFRLHDKKYFPYWRVVSSTGHLMDMVYSSKESQKEFLSKEHLDIKEDTETNSYSVVNYKKHLFSFDTLNISVRRSLKQILKDMEKIQK